MNIQRHLITILAALVLSMVAASPFCAAAPALEDLKAKIDAVVGGLGPATNGIVEWVGADPFELRSDGDTLIAAITGARLTINADDAVHVTLDRVEVRHSPAQDGKNSADLAVLLPKQVKFAESDGTDTDLAIEGGQVNVAIDAKSGRIRATAGTIAGVRIVQPITGAWLNFGPVSMTLKLVAEPDGRWNAPTEFELRKVDFRFPQAPGSGGIDRIAFSGMFGGPKLDELERLRDALADLASDKAGSLDVRFAQLLALLPTVPSVFSTVRGSAVLEGLRVRDGAGEPVVLLSKAEFATGLSGLDGENATLRFTVREDGLAFSPSLVDAPIVPHRIVIDFGVENLSTAALRALLRAVPLTGSAGEVEAQQATQLTVGALAMLNPVSRIYELAIDTQDVGASLTAESKGTPLSSTGYSADGDLVVRGWDALPKIADGTPLLVYLPFLRELAETVKAPDGSPRLKFHIASTSQKSAMINGNDVSLWFEESELPPGQPRLLRPIEPPMQGGDVKDVQRALTAAKQPVAQNGVYSISTATAVARFQKQKGLNVSGVVDAATRRALGLRAPAARPDRN